jgi:cytochrome b6-f complex iron-sulfur subunit
VTAVDPTTEPASNRSRREVLCGLVVALVAPGTLVAACGGDSHTGGGGGGTPAGGGSTPTGGGGTTTGGGAGGGAGSSALAAVSDVPQGGGLIVDNPSGGKLLLVRPAANQVKAYNAACTHQGTTVDPPKNGVVTCPNHGSQFDPTSGAVKRGPATKALGAVAVKVDGANVVLA